MADSRPPKPDELRRDKIRPARTMSEEERLLAGPRLFDYACRIALDGIRNQFPNASETEVREILRRRLEIARRLEQQT